MANSERPLVNGCLLNQYKGQHVTIMGTIANMNPNGISFEMRSVDDKTINVKLQQTLNEPISGLIEVHGESIGNNTVYCNNLLTFPQEYTEGFDFGAHNEIVMIINTAKDIWNTSS